MLVFLAHPARGKQKAEDKHRVRARRDLCSGLFARGSPGQLGGIPPCVGTEVVPGGWKRNEMSNSYHMDKHAGSRTKGQNPDCSRCSALKGTVCFYFQSSLPFVWVTTHSHSGVTFPTHVAIRGPDLSKGLPFPVAGGKVTQNGLPKTGGNCAQERASHDSQSHCICEPTGTTKNRTPVLPRCDPPRRLPVSPAVSGASPSGLRSRAHVCLPIAPVPFSMAGLFASLALKRHLSTYRDKDQTL